MNATVPVIETGTGNCHIYVDASADLEMAKNILVNAKCQRPSVCNAAESLLVHRDVAAKFLPMAAEGLAGDHVTIHGCARTTEILGDAILPATDEDYGREYLGYEISCKVVDSLDEAIDHINRFNTGHSECSSPVTTTLRSVFWRKWTRRRSMSTPPRALQTASSSASARRSAFPLRSCTHAADGTECADHDQVYHLRKRTGKSMNKTMEKEYKWRADELLLNRALLWASSAHRQPEPHHPHGVKLFRYRGRDAAQ